MIFERFEDDDLSHFSYAVGCPGARQVAIVDPRRDIDVYLRFAERRGVRISHVLETHIHADFASGARELSEATGAELLLSAYDEGELFEVQFPHTELHDGDSLQIGGVRIQAVHTPGHTPEHLAFLVYDTNRSAEVPQLFLSGDFLFVGSVGRPDLLGEEAKLALANALYDSIVRVLPGLPDGIEIHPAHGSESMCGAGISGRPTSTLGYERVANPYLQPLARERFVEQVLSNVPPLPAYYRRMKRLNSEGAPALRDRPRPAPIPADRFRELIEQGHVVVDLRDKESFAGGHLPGAYYVGHRPAMWGSWTVPYDTPILLVADDAEHAHAAWYRGLARVGLDDVRGYLEGGMAAWEEAGYDVATLRLVGPGELYERLRRGESIDLLDVRGDAQWALGHVEGARHIVAGRVQDRLDELPVAQERPLALVCNTGFQSTVVASVLERAGHANLLNVAGGMTAWRQAGLPLGARSAPAEA